MICKKNFLSPIFVAPIASEGAKQQTFVVRLVKIDLNFPTYRLSQKNIPNGSVSLIMTQIISKLHQMTITSSICPCAWFPVCVIIVGAIKNFPFFGPFFHLGDTFEDLKLLFFNFVRLASVPRYNCGNLRYIKSFFIHYISHKRKCVLVLFLENSSRAKENKHIISLLTLKEAVFRLNTSPVYTNFPTAVLKNMVSISEYAHFHVS